MCPVARKRETHTEREDENLSTVSDLHSLFKGERVKGRVLEKEGRCYRCLSEGGLISHTLFIFHYLQTVIPAGFHLTEGPACWSNAKVAPVYAAEAKTFHT